MTEDEKFRSFNTTLVRLKALIVYIGRDFVLNGFNTTLVRLKEATSRQNAIGWPRFNTTLVRLKAGMVAVAP